MLPETSTQNSMFVSDRFSTSLANLDPGNYRLALMDVATGRIEPLPGFAEGKNIDPQWGPDAKSLYFVSDRNGISNVYRLDLGSRGDRESPPRGSCGCPCRWHAQEPRPG